MKIAVLVLAAAFLAGCNTAPQPVANGNSAPVVQNSEHDKTVIAHTTESRMAPISNGDQTTGTKSKWTQSGDPIDTKEFDTAIASAEKQLKSKPNDATEKKALADAYFQRGDALTHAHQYASALGDYRRTLKYDPDNAQAKDWINQIIGIYGSLAREAPPEGQEPPPLPLGQNRLR